MAETPTMTAYHAFEHAYEWLSTYVFLDALGHRLPPCLITLQRRRATYGYFGRDGFAHRYDGRARTDEIALNPDLFPNRSDKEILSTLAHEAVHCYQRWHGKPGRRGYHNREWALMMEMIGLVPSHTGQPGGRKTGQQMSDYILPGGAFDDAITALLDTGFRVPWQSGLPDALRLPGGSALAWAPLRRKTTFTCPQCAQRAWAKPTAQLLCGVCQVRMHAETAAPEQRNVFWR